MNVVVAYDIRDNDRRARLAAPLGSYGLRIQKSVFECILETDVLAELVNRAEGLLDLDHDVFHVFPQCADCTGHRHVLGQTKSALHERVWIV